MHALSSPEVTTTRPRPRLTTGIALVGAAAIAITPLAITGAPAITHDVHHAIDSAATSIKLTGLEMYQQVIADAVANFEASREWAVPGAFPILEQILSNQQANLSALGSALGTFGPAALEVIKTEVPQLLAQAAEGFAKGDLVSAVNAVLTAAILPITAGIDLVSGPIIPAIQQALAGPVQNLANVINQLPNMILSGALVPLSPLLSGGGALVQAVQNVIDAVQAADPAKALDAVVSAPAVVLDGILNGGYGMSLAPLVGLNGLTVQSGGLLNPGSFTDDGRLILPGSLQSWQTLQQTIVAALTPPAAPSSAVSRTLASSSPTDISAVRAPVGASTTAVTLDTRANSADATPAPSSNPSSTPVASTPAASTPSESASAPSTTAPESATATETASTGSSGGATGSGPADSQTGSDEPAGAQSEGAQSEGAQFAGARSGDTPSASADAQSGGTATTGPQQSGPQQTGPHTTSGATASPAGAGSAQGASGS